MMAETPEKPEVPPRASNDSGCLKLIVVMVLAPIILFGGCTAYFMLKPKEPEKPSSSMAIIVCERAVKEQLKAPSTAKFSGSYATAKSGGGYRVEGNVDSQNSFGAMIRARYVCESSGMAGSMGRVLSLG